MSLKMFRLRGTHIVATDQDDAWGVWEDHCGETAADYDEEDMETCEPEWKLRIMIDGDGSISDHGDSLELTCAEWIEREGRGYLCSEGY